MIAGAADILRKRTDGSRFYSSYSSEDDSFGENE